jgi:hypothetical protein
MGGSIGQREIGRPLVENRKMVDSGLLPFPLGSISSFFSFFEKKRTILATKRLHNILSNERTF